ncbi:MAG: hypothetical protein QOE77_488 [Blastocatellia bacterium]|jgi:hypothetical protein|nr:hypothetical protein [Blastocatellia bacterium]
MYLIQFLLPLSDNEGKAFSRSEFENVRAELTEQFGGVTAFLQSPALGLWKDENDQVSRDAVVMFEVMAEELDKAWWSNYQHTLEQRFRQEELVVRAISAEKL